MTEYFEITIPSVSAAGQPILPELRQRHVVETCEKLTETFGGSTATEGIGHYRHESGKFAVEQVTIIKAYALDGIDSETADDLRDYAAKIKQRLSQESVLISFSGDIEFI